MRETPLAYPDAESLISVKHAAPGLPDFPGTLGLSAVLVRTYRSESRTFGPIGLWRAGTATVTVGAEPEQVATVHVSEGTLEALAVQPAIGRAFSPADFASGSADTFRFLTAEPRVACRRATPIAIAWCGCKPRCASGSPRSPACRRCRSRARRRWSRAPATRSSTRI